MKRNKELVEAIKNHNLEKVKDLTNEFKYLDMAADVNYQPENDNSPLHYAVDVQDLNVCKVLIERFAEVNAQNMMGRTPLH